MLLPQSSRDIPEVDKPVEFDLILPESPPSTAVEPPNSLNTTNNIDTQKTPETKNKIVFDPSDYLDQKDAVVHKTKADTKNEEVMQEIGVVDVKKTSPKILPESVQLDLTFWSQAPDGDRNQPRQDACEEASIILPAYRLTHKSLTREQFTQEILNLVALQNTMFGSYVDTTVTQTQEMYDAYYGIGTTTILDNPTSDQLREELAA